MDNMKEKNIFTARRDRWILDEFVNAVNGNSPYGTDGDRYILTIIEDMGYGKLVELADELMNSGDSPYSPLLFLGVHLGDSETILMIEAIANCYDHYADVPCLYTRYGINDSEYFKSFRPKIARDLAYDILGRNDVTDDLLSCCREACRRISGSEEIFCEIAGARLKEIEWDISDTINRVGNGDATELSEYREQFRIITECVSDILPKKAVV